MKQLLLLTALLTILSISPVQAGKAPSCGSGVQKNLQILEFDENEEGFGDGSKIRYKGVVYFFARRGYSAIDNNGKPVKQFFKYMKVCEAQRFMQLVGFNWNERSNVIYVRAAY